MTKFYFIFFKLMHVIQRCVGHPVFVLVYPVRVSHETNDKQCKRDR